jgi:hypothetical protein
MGQAHRGGGGHPTKEGDTRECNMQPETFPRADIFPQAGSHTPAIGARDGATNLTQNSKPLCRDTWSTPMDEYT